MEGHGQADSHGALLASVREALADQGVAASVPHIEAAVASGAPWPGVVSAVADAVTARQNAEAQAGAVVKAAQLPWKRTLIQAGLWALIGMGSLEAGFALGAVLLSAAARLGPRLADALHFADPIYTRAAIETLGYLVPTGLDFGERWPIKVAVEPGAGALASLLAATFANALVILLAFRVGGLAGRVLTVIVVAHLALVPPMPWDLEASGLSFAIGVIAPEVTGRSMALTDLLQPLPVPLASALLVAAAALCVAMPGLLVARRRALGWVRLYGGLIVLGGAAAAIIPVQATQEPEWVVSEWALLLEGQSDATRAGEGEYEALWLATDVRDEPAAGLEPGRSQSSSAMQRASGPGGSVEAQEASGARLSVHHTGLTQPTVLSRSATTATPPAVSPDAARPPGAGVVQKAQVSSTQIPTPIPRRAPLTGVSRVETIMHSLPETRFEYRVNGKREVIRGMGYNAQYSKLPRDERQRRMVRDFARMAALGVNTVQGWNMELFDEGLMNAAAANGLGVILPFELDPKLDYSDFATRTRLMGRIEEWVRRFRTHPALHMWALGNEVLHKMVRPTWLGGMNDAPEKQARARAFSEFLLDAAERVWQMDKNHPLTYREAEYGFLVWLREAMEKRDGMPENMVIGTNAYTRALQEVVEGWPDLWMTVPLYVSEFGAAGRAPGERAAALRKMWQTVRSRPQWTYGGVVYVWTTDGPEEVDRAFGLVDRNGAPVGQALAAVGEMFRTDSVR
jgi:hypothetical protein